MERSKEEVKEFVLEVIKEDPYYEDGDLDEIIIAINRDERPTLDQKEILTRVLSNSASMKMEKIKHETGSSLLLEIDVLSIYSDAYGLYCMRG